MSSPSSGPATRNAIPLLLAALVAPIALCYAILFSRLLPLPCEDDYSAILSFSLNRLRLPSASARVLNLFASQHNEYKLIFEHLILITDLALTHHVHFILLQVLGDLFLLGILYLFWRAAFPSEPLTRRLVLFLPIPFLICSLNDYAVLNFAMSSLQNIPIHFFSLLTIYLLVRKKLAFACLTAVLACFASANGFLLAPIGLLLLWPRRSWSIALLWCITFTLPLTAYLYRYQHLPHEAIKAFYYIPLFVLSFLGSSVQNKWAAAPFGLMLIALWIFAFRSRFSRTNPTIFYLSLFLIATAILASMGRAGSGLFNSVASRYQIHSNLLLASLYVFFAQRYVAEGSRPLHKNRLWLTALTAAVLFCIAGDITGLNGLDHRNADLRTGLANYRKNPAANSPMYFSDQDIELRFKPAEDSALDVMNRAVQAGIYAVPEIRR